MNSNNNSSSHGEVDQRNKESLDSRFNQTLKNVQGLLKGHSIPGKILLTRRLDILDDSGSQERSPSYQRSFSQNDAGTSDDMDKSVEGGVRNTNNSDGNTTVNKLTSSTSKNEDAANEVQNSAMGTRATDSARVTKFTKELSGQMVILERLRELAWSGVPPYMRPNVWRLLLGYAPPNSDRREGVLRRKRLEYLDCVAQFYDIPDTERSADEINMLRQIAVDCPRTVPDVPFFQQAQVQKSLERILYTWAIRHPASGYVQGINDLVTPFLVVFLSEYLEGSIDSWSISDMSAGKISNIEADCYWCLSKLLDGMQDHYTFAQPGIQRLVFKLKELVRRIDEPVSRHMEDQGLEYLQFAFRWFNCLLIREIPFHLVTRLWDTYLAEGDALPDFLVYIFASFLLTWSDELQKLDFQEMVMFLQHLPTQNWTHQELETVLSRAYIWHSMFNSSPSHLAS
ncbi:hypothetical protein ES288_A02G103300v1 [Gossypium darwinii]|uniref:Rab-GAP TBC domain-containing protein n=1 Tax=Gossypium darwinii TaxID=34276 RepID=A0A5D2HDB2_GOSDA|nr:hypothetical protein ES288_A02G103300v1 [Gossypium darwinii]